MREIEEREREGEREGGREREIDREGEKRGKQGQRRNKREKHPGLRRDRQNKVRRVSDSNGKPENSNLREREGERDRGRQGGSEIERGGEGRERGRLNNNHIRIVFLPRQVSCSLLNCHQCSIAGTVVKQGAGHNV